MKTYLHLPDGMWRELRSQLLPPRNRLEQAAFLFATATTSGSIEMRVCGRYTLTAADFDEQGEQYLEISDDCKQRVVKEAHRLGACLIEMHSHPGPWPAAFSDYDRQGLTETAPHLLWRLKDRPYGAIVVAPSGFDALIWTSRTSPPLPLTHLFDGGQALTPTNNSLEGW